MLSARDSARKRWPAIESWLYFLSLHQNYLLLYQIVVPPTFPHPDFAYFSCLRHQFFSLLPGLHSSLGDANLRQAVLSVRLSIWNVYDGTSTVGNYGRVLAVFTKYSTSPAFETDSEQWGISATDSPILVFLVLWRSQRYENTIFSRHLSLWYRWALTCITS